MIFELLFIYCIQKLCVYLLVCLPPVNHFIYFKLCFVNVQGQCGVRNQLHFYGFGAYSPYEAFGGFNHHDKSSDFGQHPWQVNF